MPSPNLRSGDHPNIPNHTELRGSLARSTHGLQRASNDWQQTTSRWGDGIGIRSHEQSPGWPFNTDALFLGTDGVNAVAPSEDINNSASQVAYPHAEMGTGSFARSYQASLTSRSNVPGSRAQNSLHHSRFNYGNAQSQAMSRSSFFIPPGNYESRPDGLGSQSSPNGKSREPRIHDSMENMKGTPTGNMTTASTENAMGASVGDTTADYTTGSAHSPVSWHHTDRRAAVKPRPFECPRCPKAFHRNHDLRRHVAIHMAVKPFPCANCDKGFSRKDALKRHRVVTGCGEKDGGEGKAAEK